MRFDQLQAGSAGSGVGAGSTDGDGPKGQGAAVGASEDGGGQGPADGAPISDAPISGETAPAVAEPANPAQQSSAVAAVAVAAPVFAISDIIRSAADQASATWKPAGVPTQRRESPATPFRTVAAPAGPSGPTAPTKPDSAGDTAATLSTASTAPAPLAVPEQPAPAGAGSVAPAVSESADTIASASVHRPMLALPAPARPVDAAIPPASPALAPAPADDAPTTLTPVVPAAGSSFPATTSVQAETERAVAEATDTATNRADTRNGALIDADADAEDAHWPGARRQIALLTIIVCLLILAVLVGHRWLPDVMGFGSLVDTFLPWTAAPLLLALPAALLSLKKWAIGIALLTCAVWAGSFGPTLLRSGGTAPGDIRVLSQNVSAVDDGTPDLSGVAELAEQRGADIVVLQGLSKNVQLADQAVPARYGYHIAMYEFVVWSRFPIGAPQPVDLGGRPADQGQSGFAAVNSTSGEFGGLLRFTVDLGQNRQATVYAVHLPQPSLSHDGFGTARGDALEQLVDDVQAETSPNLIVVGDLDVAQTDRAIRPLLASATGLVSAQAKAGSGFGFTWPATFPVVRLDDVLTRGLKPVASVVLPAVGSKQAHRPIEADLKF
ncbi:endonuclease/exonuclease/phosphatase (EEP) superfamily protein YafD [Catenulispora sp. MAP5-51]|uniref:endonuclease/exonuclease/phosphatase family protein n=1 Tax=Catenulispora sp. MAP5-51 TaxID=3156298 RepID=UPI0035157022